MDTYLLLGLVYLEVCRVSGSRVYGVIVAVIYFTPAATLFVGIIVIYFIFLCLLPKPHILAGLTTPISSYKDRYYFRKVFLGFFEAMPAINLLALRSLHFPPSNSLYDVSPARVRVYFFHNCRRTFWRAEQMNTA